jgi:hypothetical protein
MMRNTDAMRSRCGTCANTLTRDLRWRRAGRARRRASGSEQRILPRRARRAGSSCRPVGPLQHHDGRVPERHANWAGEVAMEHGPAPSTPVADLPSRKAWHPAARALARDAPNRDRLLHAGGPSDRRPVSRVSDRRAWRCSDASWCCWYCRRCARASPSRAAGVQHVGQKAEMCRDLADDPGSFSLVIVLDRTSVDADVDRSFITAGPLRPVPAGNASWRSS